MRRSSGTSESKTKSWSRLRGFRAMMRGLSAIRKVEARSESLMKVKGNGGCSSGRKSRIVPTEDHDASDSSLVIPKLNEKSARRLFFDEMERNIHKNMANGLLVVDVPDSTHLDVLNVRRDSMEVSNTRARFTLDDIFVDEVVKKKGENSERTIMSARRSSEHDSGHEADDSLAQKSALLENTGCQILDHISRPNSRGLVYSNSTGRLHIDSTLNDPDVTATIECVSRSILALVTRPDRQSSRQHISENTVVSTLTFDDDDPTYIDTIPIVQDVIAFVRNIYLRGEMHVECLVTAFIFIERLLASFEGALQLRTSNWRPIVFSTMILASKVCDDESPVNADWCYVCPSFTVRRINDLELALLTAFKFQPTVAASHYARYYFHFRSMAARLGLISGDTIQPLDVKVARRIAETSANHTLPPHKNLNQRRDSTATVTDSPSLNSQRSKSFAGQSGKEAPRDHGRVSAVLEQLVDMDPIANS